MSSATVTIDPKLADWVAEPGEGATLLLSPVFIDVSALDLTPYHPLDVDQKAYFLKHVADADATGPFARVTDLQGPWSAELIALQQLLKLRPVTIKGVEVLVDDAIGNHPQQQPIKNWKVTRWLVYKGFPVSTHRPPRSDALLLVHNDVITWKRGNEFSMTTLSWRAYRRFNPEP